MHLVCVVYPAVYRTQASFLALSEVLTHLFATPFTSDTNTLIRKASLALGPHSLWLVAYTCTSRLHAMANS